MPYGIRVGAVPIDSDEQREAMKCPHCGFLGGGLVRTKPIQPDEDVASVPDDGSMLICTACQGVVVLDHMTLTKPSDEQLAELQADPEFARAMDVATNARVTALPNLVHMLGDLAEQAGVDLDVPGLLARLASTEDRARWTTQQIQELVTQEIANHVLAVYGDERASWPPASVAALIALIRQCYESDEGMLSVLANVEEFDGYVFAVTALAEDDDPVVRARGRHLLRHLADLVEDDHECDEVLAGMDKETAQ